MAILGQIQRRSSVLIMIIALALFAFIIQGLIKNSSSLGKGNINVIAEVDGKKIPRSEFQNRVALLQKQNKRISNMQAVNMVWDKMIKEAVLNNEFEKLGIDVPQDRIHELVTQNPSIKKAFTNQQGVFDENALNDYIDQIYQAKKSNSDLYDQWKNFENSLLENEKEKIYTNLIKAAINPTINEGKWYYHYENDAVDFRYAAVPYATVPDSLINVTKDEIKAYVEKHKDQFESPESRDIEYVFIPLKASTKDEERVLSELKNLIEDKEEYDANAEDKKKLVKGFKNTDNPVEFAQQHSDFKQQPKFYFKNQLPKPYADSIINLKAGDIFGPYKLKYQAYLTKVLETKKIPDSAKAAHILIAYKGALRANPAIDRTKEEAKKKADSLLKVVKRNPAKFADYAKAASDGPTKTKGGDLGWFTYGQMVPEFNDFVFEGKKGQIGLVETPFGYHIIKINDLTEPKQAVKTISIIRTIEPSQETENEVFAKAAEFASEATESHNFEKLAEEKGYQVKPVMKIRRFEDNLPGLGQSREIVRWAYKKDRKIGDINKFDTEKGHVIVILTAKKDKGLMSIEEASLKVKPLLIKQKKGEIIVNDIKGKTIDEIEKNPKAKVGVAKGVTLKNPVIPGFGKEPKVVAKAFVLEIGKDSDPIEGNRAVYVISTQKIEKAQDIKNYIPYVEKLKKEEESGLSSKIVQALKEKAEIEDNRANIYQ